MTPDMIRAYLDERDNAARTWRHDLPLIVAYAMAAVACVGVLWWM